MAPKSPMLKALKGNQNKLPQQLQDAIEAAPESPAKDYKKGYYGAESPAKQVGKKKSITPDAMRTKKEKERQAKLTAVRENSRAMKEERAVLAKRKRNSKLGSSNEELAVIDRLQKKGRTKDVKKS